MKWLAVSVVLTVLLNAAIRLWPGAGQRSAAWFVDWANRQQSATPDGGPGRVRVIAPWKAMLIGSVVLTVLLNVMIRLF